MHEMKKRSFVAAARASVPPPPRRPRHGHASVAAGPRRIHAKPDHRAHVAAPALRLAAGAAPAPSQAAGSAGAHHAWPPEPRLTTGRKEIIKESGGSMHGRKRK